ncbi:conserved membrane hypothetical protein [Hyphomicrobiales bacterium]|nr:conserved membrane hypothetical protein [Hyphomicrobiales bacterium]CAH1700793.1 conserved membrane hypothetical protein [Hyphomicrobiales bacterium]CAI0344666.1 DUF2721 domain-containing protein [Hyphomicrobiales bacterium]
MNGMFDFLQGLLANVSSDELGRIMLRATAPVFLLSAVASFISLLATRYARVEDRIRSINGIQEQEGERVFLKSDLPRLKRRARLLHRAVRLALLSGIATSLIVVFMYSGAFLSIQHQWGAAALFTVAQILFASSLVCFALELQIGISNSDNYG